MTNPIEWVSYELKRLSPKWRGLGLMTVGFLSAVAGALLAVVSAYLFSALDNSESLTRHLVVGLGWVVMLAGAVVMAAGIIWHWFSMFSVDKTEK